MTEEQLRRLMRQAPAKGDRALFDTYYNYVYAIVCRRLAGIGTREDVEECVADVFLEVMQRIDLISPGSLRSYIGTAAKNRALNACRSLTAAQHRTAEIEEDGLARIPSGEDVAETAEQQELARRLLRCIESLGEPDASILLYKFYYDKTSGEIGRLLGLSSIAVRSRCSRALKKLRTMLDDLR